MYAKIKYACENCEYVITLESDVKIDKITKCPNCGQKNGGTK